MWWLILLISLVILAIMIIVVLRTYFSCYQLEPFEQVVDRTKFRPDEYKSGDLVLFRWNSDKPRSYGSEVLVNELRGAIPTHIGLLLRKNGKLYCAEATIWDWAKGKVSDIYNPERASGTKLCDFEEMVKIYPGQIFIRKLNKPLTDQQQDLLERLTKDHRDEVFDMSIRNASGGVTAIGMYDLGMKKLGKWWRSKVRKEGIYCSEYIARLLQNLGILSKDRANWSYAPYMLTKKSPHNAQLINGYRYGDEIQIT